MKQNLARNSRIKRIRRQLRKKLFKRKGYYNNNLNRSVNLFSNLGPMSSMPSAVTARIKAGFTREVPGLSNA